MLNQKDIDGRRLISVKPSTYDKLVELGKMGSTFDDVITEIMDKAGIKAIAPNFEEI
jgi:hypothetical protein